MLEPDPELCIEYGIFSVRQAHAAGFSTSEVRRLIRVGRWHRYARGLLVADERAAQPGDHLVRAVLAAGPGAVVGFEAAAAVHGWDFADPAVRPRLILPPDVAGRGYRMLLRDDQVMLRGVICVTTPSQTALDIAAVATFERGVIAVDSGLRSGQVSLSDLTAGFASSQRRGIIAARKVLAFADPLSGSVPESEARLLFNRAGLPAPVSQFVIRCADGSLVRPDFVWEEAMLAAEIDGFTYHSGSADFQRDRLKQNKIQLLGWLVLRYTPTNVRVDGDRTVAEIWSGLGRNR